MRRLRKIATALSPIAAAGHEIGNHSFNHEPWLHLYSKAELDEEFEKTENAIDDVTGKRTVGFRGPGYSLSPTVLEVLAERGYEYDCSTLPTYIAPLARAYYFFKSPKMSDEEREKRKKLFGKFSDGFQSLKPRFVECRRLDMVEIPVTTFPVCQNTDPCELSALSLDFFAVSRACLLAKLLLRCAGLTGVQPSLLLHPLDFLSGDDAPELKFFPGMNVPSDEKLAFVSEAFEFTQNISML